jgi:hypothetical protein
MRKLAYIILNFTIIFNPIKLNVFERKVIDVSFGLFPVIIVDLSLSMEFIIIPLAFIGYSLIIIVKLAIAIH